MTLQDIGQAVAIIGVIVSLVYLAYEIRQNTITMRRTASMEIVRSLNDLGRYFLEYPELARLYLNMNEQPQQLNELDHFRYQLLMMNILSNFELAIDYHRDGLLSNQGLETYSQSVARLFNNPVVVEWWQSEGQELYSPKLRRLVTKHTRA